MSGVAARAEHPTATLTVQLQQTTQAG